jgi:DNA helicase HerA-like ATPase
MNNNPDIDNIVPEGRIIGKNVTEIRYRSSYNENMFLGEILLAENDENELKFLLRVFDIEYGAEASSRDWPERTAGNMMIMDCQEDRSYDLHDKDRRLFKVGVCSPLGYFTTEGTEFRKPKTIPPHFSRIRKAGKEDYDILHQFMGDIYVGDLRSGETRIDFPVGISGEHFPSHIGIFATTGMGKSNLMKRLAAAAMESGKYGLLILDPHGEYFDGGKESLRGLKHHPLASEMLEVYSARELSAGNYNKIKISAREIEIEDLMQLYDFSDAQRDAFNSAARVFSGNWLLELLEHDIEELMLEMEGTFEGTLGVIRRRLMNLFKSNILTKDKTVSIIGAIYESLKNGKVVLVDTSNMGEAEELLVSVVLARAVFERNKVLFAQPDEFKKIPEMLITMEEAQRVLSKVAPGGRSNIFAKIAREGRKFKTGLCAISQQPKLIDEEIISQFNTLFILGLADKRDRDILRDSAKQDVSQLSNEIQMLMPGEALITSPFTPFALPTKIHLYEEYLESIQDKFQVKKGDSGAKVDEGFF